MATGDGGEASKGGNDPSFLRESVYRIAGAIGLDPKPYRLWQLVSLMHGAHPETEKAQKAKKAFKGKRSESYPITKENIQMLKAAFVKEK